MATAKRCDRCNKFYIENTIVIDRWKSSQPVIGFQYRTVNDLHYPVIDLCDECLSELKDWMKGIDTNEQ